MRFHHLMSVCAGILFLFRGTVWAESIKLSVTPTVFPLEARENAVLSGCGSQSKTISFHLKMEKKSNVEIDIFNTDGKQVAVIKKVMPAGSGNLVWDCSTVPSGAFQARVKVDGVEKKSGISLVK